MKLRDYQLRVIDDLRALIAQGKRRLVLVCPTGGGKTIVASEMIRSAVKRGTRVIVLAHRKELIDQTVDKLARFGVSAGVVMASDRRRDDFLPVQVCSTQTLARRLDRLPPAGLIVYDEVHHAASNTSKQILAAYADAVVIGLTATPWRTDRLGLADYFQGSVLAATPAELMSIGALVPYDAFAYDSPDLHDVGVIAGDFNQKELGLACNTEVLVGSVVREYLEHAAGRRAIVFPVNVEHSKTLVAEFASMGVRAAHVDAHTPKLEREQTLAALGTGAVTVVSSVGVLTEGFDCPAAEVCILARPTKSLSLHLQMIGRVLRPADGKERALIHDHAGNLLRLGLVEEERDYALTATPKRVKELHTCPECLSIFGTLREGRWCPKCSALIDTPMCKLCLLEMPPKARAEGKEYCECPPGASRAEKIVVAGQRINIGQIRAKRAAAGLTRELDDRDLARIATASRREMAAEYLRLCCVAEVKGFKPGFVAHQFRETFGTWPRFDDADLDGVDPAREPFLRLLPKKRAA